MITSYQAWGSKEKGKAMNEIELKTDYAVVELPENAVEVDIVAKVYIDGKVQTVKRTMDMNEIRTAFKEAAENYIPSDAVIMLTEKGRAMLNE
jgi:hypothetical protein